MSLKLLNDRLQIEWFFTKGSANAPMLTRVQTGAAPREYRVSVRVPELRRVENLRENEESDGYPVHLKREI